MLGMLTSGSGTLSRMTDPRMLDLLRKAARTLDRGGDPFHRAWLSFNDVEYEERIEMKEITAGVLHWIVNQDAETQARIISERR